MGRNSAGKSIMLENSSKVVPWRNDVVVAAEGELDRIGRPAPLDGPLSATMVFTFLRPKSVKRSKRSHPSVSPDLSKIVRSTEDALKTAGVIRDDCLIVELVARKTYENEDVLALDRSGAVIIIEPVLPLVLPPSLGGELLQLGA
jgi:Holliday junction resolvase RusA-like endonuclease